MKNIINLIGVLFLIFGVITACSDDNETESIVKSFGNTTVSSDLETSPLTVVEGDTTFTLTFALDLEQNFPTTVNIEAANSSSATEGEDFTLSTHEIDLSNFQGKEGFSVDVTLTEDYMVEEDETIILRLTSEPGGNFFEPYEILVANIIESNATGDDLSITLSWSTDFEDVVGQPKAPETVADYRLLIINQSTMEVDTVIDGAAFETYTAIDSLFPDGTYTVAADLYGAVDAGDLGGPFTVDFQLDFEQLGLINTTLEFPEATTTIGACPNRRIVLSEFTKSGTDFTINEDFESGIVESFDPMNLVGQYGGQDVLASAAGGPYDADVTITESGGSYFLEGVSTAFMSGPVWGEIILDTAPVEFEFDEGSVSSFTIPQAYSLQTDFNGSITDYEMVGSGSIDVCTGVITLKYEMVAPFGSVAQDYIFGVEGAMFTAILQPM